MDTNNRKARSCESTEDRDQQSATCPCGNPITFTCTHLCEDCWVAQQNRWHGYDQSVKIVGL